MKSRWMLVLLVGILAIAGCGSADEKSQALTAKDAEKIEVNVSAALGLKEVLTEAKEQFEKKNPNVTIVYNLGASGALQRQIEQGVPADLFLSAADKQLEALAAQDLLEPKTRMPVAGNELVLIVAENSTVPIKKFEDLASEKINSVGMGNLETVPAGQYSKELLSHLGIWDAVQNKAVYAKDVKTVATYVATRNLDAGIVFSTVAAITPGIQVVAAAPPNFHAPIRFSGAVLKNSKQKQQAYEFLQYLGSNDGTKLLQKYGFIPLALKQEKN